LNNGKKTLNIAISLILCLPVIFIIYLIIVYSSHNIAAKDINQVNITLPSDEIILYTDKTNVDFYLNAMLDAHKISKAPRDINNESESAVVIGYQRPDKQVDYLLFPSLDAKECFMLSPDGEYLLLDEETSEKLLLRDELVYLYDNAKLPELTITASGIQSKVLPVEYTWNYRKSDNTYYKDTQTELQSDDVSEYELFSDMVNVLQFVEAPDVVSIDVYDYVGNRIYQSDSLNISQLSFGTDMSLVIYVHAKWNQTETNTTYGIAEYKINARYDIPAKFTISSEQLSQGDILTINASFLDSSEVIVIETNLKTSDLKFFNCDPKYIALLPISNKNSPGIYSMKLKAGGRETNFDITVNQVDNTIYHITPTKTLSSSAYTEFNELLLNSYIRSENLLYIEDGITFLDPISGEAKYYYSDELFYDPDPASVSCPGNVFNVTQGTSVKSSEAGKVIFAGETELTGKTIIIDHGMGIQTIYCHLKSISVSENVNVKKGVTIGLSGNTGYVTGNEFMFAASVNGILVNPDILLEEGIKLS